MKRFALEIMIINRNPMRTVLIILTAAILAISSSAYARLGETKVETEARYGKGAIHNNVWIKLPGGEEFGYESKSYKITVMFWKGKSVVEKYRKTATGSQGAFTDDEITTLLNANSEKVASPKIAQWTEGLVGEYGASRDVSREWRSSTGAYKAVHDIKNKILSISSTDYLETVEDMKRNGTLIW